MGIKTFLLTIGYIIFFNLWAGANEPVNDCDPGRRVIQKIVAPINFDGIPDEISWESLEPFPMITHLPVFGNPPSEKSVIKMGYDDTYLYVGAMLYVSDPSYVRPIGKKRDFFSMTCDWFGVSLDTYNDKENALLFFTNPNALRMDATVSNDGTIILQQLPINKDWNTFWEVKTSYNDQGWYLEMRIPISSLRFQESESKTVMGISFFRWIPALNEADIFPSISNEWGPTSNMKPSLYEEVVFEDLSPRKPLYITPYLLAGKEQYNELNNSETAYTYNMDYKLEPGVDIKYGINPNTVLDLTINTDFAQVEADDQQFNLTRFNLFFPEKRQFFLERSSIFDFKLGGKNSLFYSRRIGLSEGNPVRIWGGARLNSRVRNWDIGLLDMQTATSGDLPSENFGVFRVKKRVFNPYSYTGGMLTSRLGVDGSYNLAYGLDGVIRVFGDDYLTVRWAQTFQDSAKNNPLSLDPARFLVTWERRKQNGFSYATLVTYSGTGFAPGIGFELFNDYYAASLTLKYTWIMPDDSWLQSHNLSLLNYQLTRLPNNSLLMYGIRPTWTFVSKNNWQGSIYVEYKIDQLDEDFELLDDVMVPVGRYNHLSSMIKLTTSESLPFFTKFSLESGGYFDGYKISPMAEPTLDIGASLEMGGTYRFDYVNFPERSQALANHIFGLRTLYMFSTSLSLSAFIQYNTAIQKIISNIRFRYNPKEGTDLYIVFNEGRNTWLEREVPTLPEYDQRNITLKFTYTFETQL